MRNRRFGWSILVLVTGALVVLGCGEPPVSTPVTHFRKRTDAGARTTSDDSGARQGSDDDGGSNLGDSAPVDASVTPTSDGGVGFDSARDDVPISTVCTSAADCPPDFECGDGFCLGGTCTGEGDCPAGYGCFTRRDFGICVGEDVLGGTSGDGTGDARPCEADAACPEGQRCLGGRCIDSETEDGWSLGDGACRSNADCPEGRPCLDTGRCAEPEGTLTRCVRTADCPENQICRDVFGNLVCWPAEGGD